MTNENVPSSRILLKNRGNIFRGNVPAINCVIVIYTLKRFYPDKKLFEHAQYKIKNRI